jgi:GDP-4-dehydro-6-deoxy-D-mannose reductase
MSAIEPVRICTLPNGAVLNIASGVARSLQQALDLLLSQTKIDIALEVDPGRLRPSDTPVAVGNAARARDLLGWQPTHSFSQTLASVLDYWREQAPQL